MMHNFIAQLMRGPCSVLALAHAGNVSMLTAKIWLKYFCSAGIAECLSEGFRLRVDHDSFTPTGPVKLHLMAQALKQRQHPALDQPLLRDLEAAGVLVLNGDCYVLATVPAVRPVGPEWVKRLTATQLATLRILARTGNIKSTAKERNVSEHAIISMLKDTYARMGVHSSTTAAYMLGLLDGAST